MGQKKASSAVRTNSSGALKAGVKLVSTILAASTACQGSRVGTSSGKRVLFPKCSSRRIRINTLTYSRHGPLPGSCMDRGVLGGGFCEENTLYEATELSSLLRGTRRRSRPTSRPPIKSTGLEIELTKHTVFS